MGWMVPRVLPVPQVPQARLALLARRVPLVLPDQLVPPVLPELRVPQVPQVPREPAESTVLMESTE